MMRNRLSVLTLVALVLLALVVAACREIPTARPPAPAGTSPPYPPPDSPLPTPRGVPPPTPAGTVIPPIDLGALPPVVDITRPIRHTMCTPTPSAAERSAVAALGLSDKISFELQRAIHLSQLQGIPARPAHLWIGYSPDILTITETIVLVEGWGFKVTNEFAMYHFISGDMPLEVIPSLAAEPGIIFIGLVGLGYFDSHTCPTPGGPTPVPVTPRWGGGP